MRGPKISFSESCKHVWPMTMPINWNKCLNAKSVHNQLLFFKNVTKFRAKTPSRTNSAICLFAWRILFRTFHMDPFPTGYPITQLEWNFRHSGNMPLFAAYCYTLFVTYGYTLFVTYAYTLFATYGALCFFVCNIRLHFVCNIWYTSTSFFRALSVHFNQITSRHK